MTESSGTTEEAREVQVWHDESDRLVTWGSLDPPNACMCVDCVLGDSCIRPGTGGDPR